MDLRRPLQEKGNMNPKKKAREVLDRVKKRGGRASMFDALEWAMWESAKYSVVKPTRKRKR